MRLLEEILPFPDLTEIADVAASAIAVYFAVVLMVRLSGKRTTGELNSFDWLITVVVGSLMASGILLDNVKLIEAVIAMIAIALCQWTVTFLVTRTRLASKVFKAEPTLLLHEGRMLKDTMKRTRISEEEVRMALRENGIVDIDGAQWVVLETNGQLSVIPRQEASLTKCDAMEDVRAPSRLARG